MLRMIWGIHSSRAVYVAARLGIAELLANGPVSAAELARITGTHQPSLYRVLRLLAALDVFDEVSPGSFGLTALGDRLRSGAPASMRSWAIFLEAVGGVLPFEHILDTVRTGTPGIDIAFGMGLFELLAQHPGNAATFDAAMSERTAAFAPSVADAYDFSDIRSIVDVGGGKGTLLAEILRRHSHLHGSLFETAAVAARAEAVLDGPSWPIDARCWPGTSSSGFRAGPTAMCWPTCCTTGTTGRRSPSSAIAAIHGQGRPSADRRTADPR